MPVKQLNYWKKYLPNLKTIANVYGPTEATVNCTYYIVDREFSDSEVLPLGKACENTGLLVLDEDNNIIASSKVNELGEVLCLPDIGMMKKKQKKNILTIQPIRIIRKKCI